MRVLVTGSAGRVGRATVTVLEEAGHEVVPFDRAHGDDVLDLPAVGQRMSGCDALVHLAAIPDDHIAAETETIGSNVAGLWSVLEAARKQGVSRIVSMSSIQASGVSQSHRDPDYLPLDDDHPSYPLRPYPLSKLLGEHACAAFTRATGVPTVSLRPPNVLAPEEYAAWQERRRQIPEVEDPVWNYGSWIDARDLATAVERGLTAPDTGSIALFVAADDIASNRPGRDVVTERYPHVPWRGPADSGPYDALVSCARAKQVLGWQPRHRWGDWRETQP